MAAWMRDLDEVESHSLCGAHKKKHFSPLFIFHDDLRLRFVCVCVLVVSTGWLTLLSGCRRCIFWVWICVGGIITLNVRAHECMNYMAVLCTRHSRLSVGVPHQIMCPPAAPSTQSPAPNHTTATNARHIPKRQLNNGNTQRHVQRIILCRSRAKRFYALV